MLDEPFSCGKQVLSRKGGMEGGHCKEWGFLFEVVLIFIEILSLVKAFLRLTTNVLKELAKLFV